MYFENWNQINEKLLWDGETEVFVLCEHRFTMGKLPLSISLKPLVICRRNLAGCITGSSYQLLKSLLVYGHFGNYLWKLQSSLLKILGVDFITTSICGVSEVLVRFISLSASIRALPPMRKSWPSCSRTTQTHPSFMKMLNQVIIVETRLPCKARSLMYTSWTE